MFFLKKAGSGFLETFEFCLKIRIHESERHIYIHLHFILTDPKLCNYLNSFGSKKA